jgi:hypothetical protein
VLLRISAALYAILAALGAVRPARAEPILPVGEVAAVINQPAGALGDELGAGWAMRVDAGIGRGPIALTLPFEVGAFEPRRPERDSQHLVALGTGVALTGVVYQSGRFGLRARAGYQWRWLGGDGEVLRTCDQVGGCDGGYWHESPSYLLSGPSAALAATWSWPIGEARAGFALEAGIERARIDLPGAGTVTGPLVAVGVSVWLAPALAP